MPSNRLICAVLFIVACEPAEPGDLDTHIEDVTVCAAGQTVEGIDVSVYQGTINWGGVAAAGKKFAIVRVSDGTGTMDSQFARNWSGAKAAGLVRGTYQFFRASEDATAQANLVVSQLNAAGGLQADDLPVVADVEVSDGQSTATIAAKLTTWMARVHQGTGKVPLVYTSPGVWGNMGNPQGFSSYILWVAHYGVQCPLMPSGWSTWKFWQYSSTGSVGGISGNVDLDKFNGSLSELMAFARGPAVMPDAGVTPDAATHHPDAGGTGGTGDVGGGGGSGGSGGGGGSPANGPMVSGCSVAPQAGGGGFFILLLLLVARRSRAR
jgi:lysozyme